MQKSVTTRRSIITGAALAMAGVALRAPATAASTDAEVSYSAEAIHQERVIKASRTRVFQALMVTAQFDKIIQLSGVMAVPQMAKMQKPTQIDPRVGGGFSIFGGLITGRQVALVTDKLIVQAWRVGDWPRGIYSIARFDLLDQGADTKLVFDHTGFPKGAGKELASGWQEHYWDPLIKFLG
jgi:activator of HSP90 ATPase